MKTPQTAGLPGMTPLGLKPKTSLPTAPDRATAEKNLAEMTAGSRLAMPSTPRARYRVVQCVDNRLVATEPADIFAWAEAAGFEFVKLNSAPKQRAELQGQPIFRKLYGPMWDDGTVRYEDQAAFETLSA